jgi:hypothetical protein
MRLLRQSGHVEWESSHVSMHSRWKAWLHLGSSRSWSSGENSQRADGAVQGVLLAAHHVAVQEHGKRVDEGLVHARVVQVEQLLQLPLERRHAVPVLARAPLPAQAEQVARQQVKQPTHEEEDRQDGQREDDARAYLVVQRRRGRCRRLRRRWRRHQPRRIAAHPCVVCINHETKPSLSLSGYLEEGLLDLFGLGRWWMRMAMQQGRRESRQEQKEMRRVPAAVSGLEGREALCEKSSMD